MAQLLQNVAEGTIVTVMEDTGLEEYTIMKQGSYIYPNDYGMAQAYVNIYSGMDGIALLVRNNCPGESRYSRSLTTIDYASDEISQNVENTFLPKVTGSLGTLIKEVTVPYREARNKQGSSLKPYTGSAFVVSRLELSILYPDQNDRISNFNGEPVNYFTRDAQSGISNAVIEGVASDGTDVDNMMPTTSTPYRPVIAVDATLAWVSDSGQVVANTPPVITGTDGDIGTFGETSPTYAYTVTDPQGGTVSVTEALDGVTLRTYNVTLGQQNTLTIPAATYLTTLNGTHTLTITATDSVGASTVRTETFTKNVTSCAFTQTAAFTVDDMPTRCVVNIQGAFPEGSVLTVQICNNGNDASPTWETITQQALLGQKYFFQNETKTAANWGVKVQASLSRGTAEGDCYISSIGGVFQ